MAIIAGEARGRRRDYLVLCPRNLCCATDPTSYADAARDVGEVVSDVGAAIEVGGLVAAAIFPPAGGAVATIGLITNGVGTAIVFGANVAQGRWGAAAGNVLSAGSGFGAQAIVGRLGQGAWRNVATGQFTRNPFGGDLGKAKQALARFAGEKSAAQAEQTIRCGR